MGLSHVQAKVLRTEGTELSQLRHLLRLPPATPLRTLQVPAQATGHKRNQLQRQDTARSSQRPRVLMERQLDMELHSRHLNNHSSRNNQVPTSTEVPAQRRTVRATVLQRVEPRMGRPRVPRDKWADRRSRVVHLTGARAVPPSLLNQVHRRGLPVVTGEGTLDGVEEGLQGACLDHTEVHLGRLREEEQEEAAMADLRPEDLGVLVDMAVAKVVGQACMVIVEEEVASRCVTVFCGPRLNGPPGLARVVQGGDRLHNESRRCQGVLTPCP
ncbi:hypothetical protein HPB50_018260 [Hyalomma asiaticum]|uniref:Uncharacterized protein n=1 Tax=Hyalomma asiaticum TaxID=266040 RepID=A0ACB7SFQ2_HYAAI|nr:hypothetical protein HPB50_018260 [Hyalomma asiaticum]